jgi:sugar (pentulose or hexulose) kinase
MEGTAFLLKMRMDSVARGMRPTQSVTMVGGPSETCPWPQIVCDVLGLPVDTVYGSCAGAAGAAILAGIGTGIYFDAHEAQRRLKPERTQRVPDPDLHGFYENLGIRFRHEFPSA